MVRHSNDYLLTASLAPSLPSTNLKKASWQKKEETLQPSTLFNSHFLRSLSPRRKVRVYITRILWYLPLFALREWRNGAMMMTLMTIKIMTAAVAVIVARWDINGLWQSRCLKSRLVSHSHVIATSVKKFHNGRIQQISMWKDTFWQR